MLHCNASNTGCAYCTKKLLKIQGLRDTAREREVTISFKRVLPSLVSLISPAPPTSLQQNQRESERETERQRDRERVMCIYTFWWCLWGRGWTWGHPASLWRRWCSCEVLPICSAPPRLDSALLATLFFYLCYLLFLSLSLSLSLCVFRFFYI